MDIFKKWWFYVIAAVVAVSLPFAIKTAISDGPVPTGDPPSIDSATLRAVPVQGEMHVSSPVDGAAEENIQEENTPEENFQEEIAPEENTQEEIAQEEIAPEENDPPEADTEPDPGGAAYVLNTNTKKFHYPTCSSVQDIKEKNRRDTTASREDLIGQGYAPCKRCAP